MKVKLELGYFFSGNLTKQPFMKNINYKIHKSLNNTDFIMNNTFWIGLYPGLQEDHLKYVTTNIKVF